MQSTNSLRVLLLATMAAAAIMGALAARAAESSPGLAETLAVEPPEFNIGDIEIRLGGFAGGALFTAHQSGDPAMSGGYNNTRASGIAGANIRAQRTLDNGMVLGLRSNFLLYRDEQSGDNYDNDTVEALYLFAQTGFGRVGIGQQDGAAFSLALVGPAVDEQANLENRAISLFRNPVTGHDFGDFFQQVTAVQSSSNFAKIDYVSPRLFGVQIGASFTPQTVRTPLPWTGNPRNDPDQQQNIWELGASYTGYFSDVAVGLSAGYARGALRNGTVSGSDLYDWALGAQFAYMLSDVKLSLGGAYRDTNAYLLDVDNVRDGTKTHAVHLSTTAERGAFRIGAEYSNADVTGPVDYEITGYETAIGYRINDNLELTAGWQWYDYKRSAGAFHNGLSTIDMNAGFLAFSYTL